jgi:hypothetical protein
MSSAFLGPPIVLAHGSPSRRKTADFRMRIASWHVLFYSTRINIVEHGKKQEAPRKQLTEPPLTLPFWAQSIDEVRPCGDWLVIHGTGASWEPIPSTPETEGIKDLLSDLKNSAPPVAFKARTSDDWTKLSRPALDFSGAKTDEALVDYVKKYGPVLAWACSDGYEVVAAQSLAVLRREQKIFAAAFELQQALRKIPKEDRTDLDNAWVEYEPARDRLNEITEARLLSRETSASEHKARILSHDLARRKLLESEAKLRRETEPIKSAVSTLVGLVEEARRVPVEECPVDIIPRDIFPHNFPLASPEFPSWELPRLFPQLPVFKLLVERGADPRFVFWYGQRTLCTVLDEFPPKLFAEGAIVQELPHSTSFGIRPALYFMLRRYFQMGKEVRFCAKCGRPFVSESARKLARFCGAECSQKQRQHEYYFDKGKKRRAKRPKARLRQDK